MSDTILLGESAGGHFTLPTDVATNSTAILGRRGSGKTVTARGMVEEFMGHGVQTVIIDPLDVWWGLRANRSGEPKGCNIVIAGGCKADLPLREQGGELLADLVVDHGINLLVVLAELSKAGARRFVADFCERLYHRKNQQEHRTPTALVIDEADAFTPQRLTPDATRCFGAVDTIVRRGRSRGLGSVLISQRPATIAKDVLSQIEVLIAMQVTAPQDRKALREWVDGNATPEEGRTVLDSLSTLKRGESWVWAPGLNLLERVQIRLPNSYDSSYTPKVNEKRPASPVLRAIDLDAVRQQMATVVEEAMANDPKVLHLRIKELAEQLRTQAKPVAQGFTQTHVDLMCSSAVTAAIVRRDNQWKELVVGQIDNLRKTVDITVEAGRRDLDYRAGDPIKMTAAITTPPKRLEIPPALKTNLTAGNPDLSKGERAVLTVLAQTQRPETQRKVALRAGYRLTSSTWRAILAELRKRNAIFTEQGGNIMITDDGVRALGVYEPLPTGKALIEHWRKELGTGAPRKIFDALVSSYPLPVNKDGMAEAAGISPTNSTLRSALALLNKLELIDGSGDARTASVELMEAV